MIQPTKKNRASKKTMCICKGQIETTIHGECGKCGKYTGFCAVGHRKDKSCCPSPSCTGWETLRDEIITTCKAWSVKYMYQKMNDLLLSARSEERKKVIAECLEAVGEDEQVGIDKFGNRSIMDDARNNLRASLRASLRLKGKI